MLERFLNDKSIDFGIDSLSDTAINICPVPSSEVLRTQFVTNALDTSQYAILFCEEKSSDLKFLEFGLSIFHLLYRSS
jgi:hypothetical protein